MEITKTGAAILILTVVPLLWSCVAQTNHFQKPTECEIIFFDSLGLCVTNSRMRSCSFRNGQIISRPEHLTVELWGTFLNTTNHAWRDIEQRINFYDLNAEYVTHVTFKYPEALPPSGSTNYSEKVQFSDTNLFLRVNSFGSFITSAVNDNSNQLIDLTVKTPDESGNPQSTAGHE